MSLSSGLPGNMPSPLKLQFPQSLAVYDDYASAQKAVDFLSDKEFPVENCLIFALFADENVLGVILSTVLIGALFGVIWALVGYAFTRGQRDFSSVTSVVATRYEVLVEHRVAAQARELLAQLPGAAPDPFA